MNEQRKPKEGELVLVNQDGKKENWVVRIFLYTAKSDTHICVFYGDDYAYNNNMKYGITAWKYIKPLTQSLEDKICEKLGRPLTPVDKTIIEVTKALLESSK